MTSRTRSTLTLFFGAHTILALAMIQGILLVPLYISILGKEMYGYWITLSGIVGFVSLLELGMAGLVTQKGSRYLGAGNYTELGFLAITYLEFCLIISILMVLAGVGIAYMLPYNFGVPQESSQALENALILSVIESVILMFACSTGSILFAFQRPLVHLTGFVCGTITGMITTFALLYLGAGLISIPIGGIVRAVIPLPFNIMMCFKLLRVHTSIAMFKPTYDRFRALLRESVILAPAQWLETLGAQVDSFICLRLFGPTAVTQLEVTKKLCSVTIPFLSRAAISLLPGLSHVHGAGEHAVFLRVARELQRVTLYIALISFVLILGANETFVSLWISPEFYCGGTVTFVIAVSGMLRIFKGLLYNLARARNEFRLSSLSSYIEFLMLLLLASLLGSYLGLFGLVLGGLISAFIGISLQYIGLSRTSFVFWGFMDSQVVLCSVALLILSAVAGYVLPLFGYSWIGLGCWSLFVSTAGVTTCLYFDNDLRRKIHRLLSVLRLTG